ncbi:UDP-glucose 4-epimerase GalE [Paraferrimonas sp. SM1919]|uniref:UDP-glucose 4-epimerase GalE n=1 Tax=Paraferrimonas sp. SM1919 TaxID=2662263 RepID=UPI0013D8D9AF|nr:UDP-glucose 4-epimerase GalE [Paraferrimonas sp. SM1919]
MSILVTGGAGYIGSHTVVELLESGQQVIVIDNLSNSSEIALERVSEITAKEVTFYQGDILDAELLDNIFNTHQIDAVIHFAGLKAVGESVAQPLRYYHNNVTGSVVLCEVMAKHGCKNLVFSSSATVYGDPGVLPYVESLPIASATSPYGQSKIMVERVLQDLYQSDNSWNIACLRYFNPVGAHESGKIGENPNGIPNNLMPFVTQVAVGKRDKLAIFGGDYPTIDGTGVRDYIHVVDLAQGHLAALKHLDSAPGLLQVNLGAGKGISVLELVHAFEKASGKTIPYEIAPRRDGDLAEFYACPEKAKQVLGWQTKLGLADMVSSSWKWQSQNPNGFSEL